MSDKLIGITAPRVLRLGRRLTKDISYVYRLNAGYPGDVNRPHPASIEPCLIDSANPPPQFGVAAIIGANNAVRCVLASDTTITDIYGIVCRPFPIQQQNATNYGAQAVGNGGAPTNGSQDILRSGYIMTYVDKSKTVTKGMPAFLWIAASTGNKIQGMFDTAATAGSTIALTDAFFNGPCDANGNVEICLRP